MEIKERKESDSLILEISGRLDAATSRQAQDTFLAALDTGSLRIVVDMKDLDYISSSGLRVFLLVLKKTRELSGKIHLAALRDHVREVFDLAGFSSFFPMFASVPEAVQALDQS
ncbi:MAG TPA: STAS domain-containing protein [Candidatus Sumerlaeota bacterium]|mgnify:CR=1 FL=1|nr:STAS domain-containing protein [Candidatus Sumerlaeota bacterium]